MHESSRQVIQVIFFSTTVCSCVTSLESLSIWLASCVQSQHDPLVLLDEPDPVALPEEVGFADEEQLGVGDGCRVSVADEAPPSLKPALGAFVPPEGVRDV